MPPADPSPVDTQPTGVARAGGAGPASTAHVPSESTSRPAASGNGSSIPTPLKPLRHLNASMISGAGAGLVSSVVTCPLDVIKTRLQAQTVGRNHASYEGVFATMRLIFTQTGIRGFYRGLGPTMLGYLPTWAIYFSVYDKVKMQLGESENGSKKSTNSISLHIIAAMTAGATGTIVTNPLWVIKTRFMAQAIRDPSQKRYRHTLDAMRTIYRSEGPRAFYKGLIPSLMGVSHVAVQFPLYEQLKLWAAPDDGAPLPSSIILLCSAASKMVAALTTYPHEVLRTRLQIQRVSASSKSATVSAVPPLLATTPLPVISGPLKSPPSAEALPTVVHVRSGGALGVRNGEIAYKGMTQTFRTILAESGWTGFYRGLSINLVRTVPNSAVTMLTYELIMRHMAALQEEVDEDD